MDKDYNATNTSAYNIYNKCYKSPANTINLGCEDETGPITYLNDADFKRNWNIKEIEGHKWEPCSQKVWTEYVGSNGSYHLMEGLIKDNMRIVLIVLSLVGLFRRYGLDCAHHRHQEMAA